MQKLSRDGVNFNPGGMPGLNMATPMQMNPGGVNSTPYGGMPNMQPMYNNNGQLINPMMMNMGGMNNKMNPNFMNQGQIIQSNCVLLSNLFDENIDLEAEPNFFTEIHEDVYDECSKDGKIETLWVDEKSPGNIWVKFEGNNLKAAALTIERLNGR